MTGPDAEDVPTGARSGKKILRKAYLTVEELTAVETARASLTPTFRRAVTFGEAVAWLAQEHLRRTREVGGVRLLRPIPRPEGGPEGSGRAVP